MPSGRDDTSVASQSKYVIEASGTYNIKDGSDEQAYESQAFETSLLEEPHLLQTSNSHYHHISPFL
jgi:hypothetical protein